MDVAACQNNLTECLTSMGLKLCDANKDICLERGLCVTSIIPTSVSVCICYPCYYGNTCEEEVFSRNLWPLGQIPQTLQLINASRFFTLLWAVIRMIDSLLCLQTYLSSQKIRITNIGVYLIFNSIIVLLGSLDALFEAILFWLVERLSDRFLHIQCLIYQKFVAVSLGYIWSWSIVSIGLERMLVECYNYSIFDSRKRSFIISTLIFIICPLTTIPGIFTLKKPPTDQFYSKINGLLATVGCVNYTQIGYTIYKVIFSIHLYGTLLSYILLCLGVFAHLLRHRQRIAPNYTILQNIRLILRNHRDFFIPLSVTFFFSMPMLVMNEIMTCSKASKLESLPYLIFVFGNIFDLLPHSFSFFYYIYPANVYMVAFWNNSPIGRCLRKLKKKIIKIGQQLKNTLLMPVRLPQLLHRETVTVEHEVTETRL